MPTPESLDQLNHLLDRAWKQNTFYAQRWHWAGLAPRRLETIEELSAFPLTSRAELVEDQNTTPPLGTNIAEAVSEFKRIHRSTGTTPSTLCWADTVATWQAAVEDAAELLRWTGLGPEDRVFVALPFGAALVPWLLYEGALSLGSATFTVGDADAAIQLMHIRNFRPNVILARPSGLAAIARAARELGISLAGVGVERIVTTGQIGGTHGATAERLRELWPAEYFDTYLLTEAGAVAGECKQHPGGMHVLDRSVVAEVVDPTTGKLTPEGEVGELVLTTLRRAAQPIIRYRTGDFVRLRRQTCDCGRTGALLFGGVRRRDV